MEYLLGFFSTLLVSLTTTSIFEASEINHLQEIQITADFSLIHQQNNSTTRIPAQLSYKDSLGKNIILPIHIRARGFSRKQRCQQMKPLRIYLGENKDFLFSKYKKLKLVSHCGDSRFGNPKDPSELNQPVLREYLTYQLAQIVSPMNYRAHLLKVTYQDTSQNSEQSGYAFLIEPRWHLQNRIKKEHRFSLKKWREDPPLVDMSDVEPENLMNFYIFQHLIGNKDWRLPNKYDVNGMNLHVYRSKKNEWLYLLPYDFDLSNFVAPEINKKPVPCLPVSRNVFIKYLKEKSELKKQFLRKIENFEYLNDQSRKRLHSFIKDRFYEIDQQIQGKRPVIPLCE